MKIILLLSLLFCSLLLYPQAKQDTSSNIQISKIENKISSVGNQSTLAEIENLKDKLAFQQKMNEQTISSVAVQLNAASNNLTLFGILFTIVAIFLGFYVTYIERKIVRIGEENKELLIKSQKIKVEVEAVSDLIQNDIHKLYLQIKREETEYILDRLIKIPKEITKVSYTLLSRELMSEDFIKLRQAYLNLDKKGPNYWHDFVKIFIRHFLAQTLKDYQLREKFSYYIGHSILDGLENEVLKCTSDLASVLVDEGIQEFKAEINYFFWGLSASKYKGTHVVYQLFFDNLRSRKNRFESFNMVESVPDKRHAKIAFGNLLLNKYSNDSPSESEKMVFKELEELIAEEQKESEEARKKLDVKAEEEMGHS